MADILEFRSEVPRSPTGSRSHAGNAEIVLFPGVRYERWVEEPEAQKPKPRRSRTRRRDVLELED